jgi:hypothetical protein
MPVVPVAPLNSQVEDQINSQVEDQTVTGIPFAETMTGRIFIPNFRIQGPDAPALLQSQNTTFFVPALNNIPDGQFHQQSNNEPSNEPVVFAQHFD